MAYRTARLLEILQIGDRIGGILDLPEATLPAPGQYLPVQHLATEAEILTRPLFRVISPAGRPALGPLPTHWAAGDSLACLPAHGRGFDLPGSARRVGLLALVGQPLRVLPLVAQALAQKASVALFFDHPLHPDLRELVPASVEISPTTALVDNLDWPDFMALEVDRENLPALDGLLGEAPLSFSGQVLVSTSMPCRGVGACGVCAVKTRHGWRQTCTDGPVFPLKELLHVAG